MPTAGTARGYDGAHATSGYDVSARRSSDKDSSRKSMNMNKRSNRRGGRK